MASNKRTPTQREYDLTRIAHLYLQGKTQAEIGELLGVSQQQVSYDLAEIKRRWREDTAINLDEAKNRELARIDLIWQMAVDAWERSQETRQKTRAERTNTAGGMRDKTLIEKEQRLGDPRYLATMQWCVTERCKLLGLYAPQQSEISGRGGEAIRVESTGDEGRVERIIALLERARARRDRLPDPNVTPTADV